MKSAAYKTGDYVFHKNTGLVYRVASDHMSTNDRIYVRRGLLHKTSRYGENSVVNKELTQITRSNLVKCSTFEAALAISAEHVIASKKARNERQKTGIAIYKEMLRTKGIYSSAEKIYGGR